MSYLIPKNSPPAINLALKISEVKTTEFPVTGHQLGTLLKIAELKTIQIHGTVVERVQQSCTSLHGTVTEREQLN